MDSNNNNNSNDGNPFIAFRHLVDQQLSAFSKHLQVYLDGPDYQRSSSASDGADSRLYGIFSQPPLYDRAMTRGRNEELGQQPVEQGQQQQQQQQETDTSRSSWWGRRHEGRQWHRHHHCHGRHEQPRQVSEQTPKPTPQQIPQQDIEEDDWAGFSSDGVKNLFFPSTSYDHWRLLSPYSPEHLQADPMLPARMRDRWHTAFLELLAEHNGEPKQLQSTTAQRPAAPMDAWEVLFRARLSFFESADKKDLLWESRRYTAPALRLLADDNDEKSLETKPGQAALAPARQNTLPTASAEHETEEAAYEWFLARQSQGASQGHQRGTAQRQSRPSPVSDQTTAESTVQLVQNAQRASRLDQMAARSGVISTIIAERTVVKADGSSETVRRRQETFADGKQEYRQDVERLPPNQRLLVEQNRQKFDWYEAGQRDARQQLAGRGRQRAIAARKAEEKKSSGWFWS